MLLELFILILGYGLMVILGIAIQMFLKPFSTNVENSGIDKAGKYIGIFERIIIFTLVLTNQYAAISIVFGAKSIARFKELNTRHFAEYYLLGTFASITVALVVGIIFKLLFGNFNF
ncbi:hypothetical protein [Methanobacterium petrolearium]|uniref:hypothetical protein n=1 Tax=Methanobacterium petrolearium TaxID=710190 RepID=UPI001FD76AD3|nr:hypothetical protein [Methanobacterium petrolearium]MBP1945387.1 hypothetical protein [Methanobacterium petrolearium]BDZ71580.1 hypothetical protein GCM10025861_20970 [Methanobacterium petrolearium]